jgi:hypothetical protein
MEEAGSLLPVSFSALPLVAPDQLPSWRADPHVIGFCQSAVISAGAIASVITLRRLLSHRRSAWLMACTLMVAIAISGRWLVGL